MFDIHNDVIALNVATLVQFVLDSALLHELFENDIALLVALFLQQKPKLCQPAGPVIGLHQRLVDLDDTG